MLLLSIAPLEPTLIQGLGYAVMGFAIVFLMLFFLVVAIKVMVAIMAALKKKEAAPAAVAAPAAPVKAADPNAGKVPAPGSLGDIAIHDVEEQDAALIMAIVADKMGAPLNELRFKSIKKVD